MSDDPLSRILSAIERLRVDMVARFDRLEIGTADTIAAPAADIVAHVQNTGDVEGDLGAWIGVRQTRLWIEGFSLVPPEEISLEDLGYRAVLGRDWLSPWVPAGSYCGSRGLALPLRGFAMMLRGTAATKYECSYSATFVDGSEVGSLANGQICAATTLAPLEAFQIVLRPRSA